MPMPALQELIHKLEVGEWTRHVKVGVALLGLLAFAVVYDIRQFKNFSTQEAMDQAQLARNIAEGKGFTTEFVRPLSFYLLQKQQLEIKQGNGTGLSEGRSSGSRQSARLSAAAGRFDEGVAVRLRYLPRESSSGGISPRC